MKRKPKYEKKTTKYLATVIAAAAALFFFCFKLQICVLFLNCIQWNSFFCWGFTNIILFSTINI